MNLKNKLDETTNKYYLITTKDGYYDNIYHGSKSDYFAKHSGVPLVTYAGKAVATLSRMLDKSKVALIAYKKSENKPTRDDLMLNHYTNRIIQCQNTIKELETYNKYDLVGIVEDRIDSRMFSEYPKTFKIVDYKRAGEVADETHELRFTELTRAQYEAFHAKKVLMREDSSVFNMSFLGALGLTASISIIPAFLMFMIVYVIQDNSFTCSSLLFWLGLYIMFFGAFYQEENSKTLFRKLKLYLYTGSILVFTSTVLGFAVDAVAANFF